MIIVPSVVRCSTVGSEAWTCVSVATALVARAMGPVRRDDGAKIVFAPHLGVGDGVPETLGRRLDVDFENLLHRLLQFLLEVAQSGSPGLGVFAHPAVVDEPDR